MANGKSIEEKALDGVLVHQREIATLYAEDSRRAFQRRIDSISMQEAYALRAADEGKIAFGAMAVRLANQNPPERQS